MREMVLSITYKEEKMITIALSFVTFVLILGFLACLGVGVVLVGLVATVGSVFAAPLAFDILMALAFLKLLRRRRKQAKKQIEVS